MKWEMGWSNKTITTLNARFPFLHITSCRPTRYLGTNNYFVIVI